MPVINILDNNARNLFEKPPQFTLSEQEYYFALPEELTALTSKIVTPSYLIGFILLFGYAKHSGKFYGSDTFNIGDIDYLCNKLQISKNKINFKNYALRTYNYHRQIICTHLNIKIFIFIVFHSTSILLSPRHFSRYFIAISKKCTEYCK